MLRSRSGGAGKWNALLALLLLTVLTCVAVAGDGKGGKRKKSNVEGSPSPSAQSLSSVPLPVGQEAKGLVLPDFDPDGHLRGRFEAGVAKRIDDNHMQLRDLRMMTFTEENKPDLQVSMSDSVLELNTRMLRSEQRTVVTRADFNIAGDRMDFDTIRRQGTLNGNVKMVITNVSSLTGKKSAPTDE